MSKPTIEEMKAAVLERYPDAESGSGINFYRLFIIYETLDTVHVPNAIGSGWTEPAAWQDAYNNLLKENK